MLPEAPLYAPTLQAWRRRQRSSLQDAGSGECVQSAPQANRHSSQQVHSRHAALGHWRGVVPVVDCQFRRLLLNWDLFYPNEFEIHFRKKSTGLSHACRSCSGYRQRDRAVLQGRISTEEAGRRTFVGSAPVCRLQAWMGDQSARFQPPRAPPRPGRGAARWEMANRSSMSNPLCPPNMCGGQVPSQYCQLCRGLPTTPLAAAELYPAPGWPWQYPAAKPGTKLADGWFLWVRQLGASTDTATGAPAELALPTHVRYVQPATDPAAATPRPRRSLRQRTTPSSCPSWRLRTASSRSYSCRQWRQRRRCPSG